MCTDRPVTLMTSEALLVVLSVGEQDPARIGDLSKTRWTGGHGRGHDLLLVGARNSVQEWRRWQLDKLLVLAIVK